MSGIPLEPVNEGQDQFIVPDDSFGFLATGQGGAIVCCNHPAFGKPDFNAVVEAIGHDPASSRIAAADFVFEGKEVDGFEVHADFLIFHILAIGGSIARTLYIIGNWIVKQFL